MMDEYWEFDKRKLPPNPSGFSGFRGLFRWNEPETGFWRAHQPMVHRKRHDLFTVVEREPFQNPIDQLIGGAHTSSTPVRNRGNVVALSQVLHDRKLAASQTW